MRRAAALDVWSMEPDCRPPELSTREILNISRLAIMWIEERIGATDVTLEEYDLCRAYADGREEARERQRKIDAVSAGGATKMFGDIPADLMDSSSQVVSMEQWFVE